MDRSWINERHRFGNKYINGVRSFLQFARDHLPNSSTIRCPCQKCRNLGQSLSLGIVENHLYVNGMMDTYIKWVHHGEKIGSNHVDDDQSVNNESMIFREEEDDDADDGDDDDNIIEAMHDIRQGLFVDMQSCETSSNQMPNEDIFGDLFREAQHELYPGCTKFSTLSFVVKLLHLKVLNRWSIRSFNMLLDLLKEAFPKGETLPKSHYELKSLLRDVGLGYESIHVCKYECALFWKEHKDKTKCPECGESRWKVNDGKGKKVPHKILRYFPLKPRLQRLFMSKQRAEDMRWHATKREEDADILRHPADSPSWKEMDEKYPEFSSDCRHVRLGLASDGFNPFGSMNNNYSMWPVVLIPYNLPPWMCMKEPHLIMSLLIPGPNAPEKDFDVYLRPLIDELKQLWDGVPTYDAFGKETFHMRAAVLWTINDFPAYAYLSGWSTKGYMACPTCNKDTSSVRLRSKICYMGHRRYLPRNHNWRKSKAFDGKSELRDTPKEISGNDILKQLRHVKVDRPGKHPNNKKRKREVEELNWTKKSIFWELPYWQKLKMRHNLDVMHIEKNIYDNLLGTMLNIGGKTKDTVKARQDLADMGIRPELHLVPDGSSLVMPPAIFTLSQQEKRDFCEFLRSVKFPDGFASNICRCVNEREGKLIGLKSHDCHVLLQRVLPVGMRGYLHNEMYTTLVELCFFFKELCCKTLKVKILEQLSKDIVIILCKLERIFPPAFFDVMVHLAIHLPQEAMACGPVHYRWMYPIERFLGTLKGYVTNRAHPEGSIAEAYIANESLTFLSKYLHRIETRFNRGERNDDRVEEGGEPSLSVFSCKARPFGDEKYIALSTQDLHTMHRYVLNNCEGLDKYQSDHIRELNTISASNVDMRHEKEFPTWFKERVKSLHQSGGPEVTDEIYALAIGPDFRARSYSGCIVNGVRFHTSERDNRRKSQNCGVVVDGVHDNNDIDFYGVLTDVIELQYVKHYRVVMFRCDWFDVDKRRKGIQTDKYFTSLNVTKKWYENEPFILSCQAKQVFYMADTKMGNQWRVVEKFTHRHLYDVPEVDSTDMEVEEAYQELESIEMIHVDAQEIGILCRNELNPQRIINDEITLDHYESDDIEDEDESLIEYADDTNNEEGGEEEEDYSD